MSKGRVYWITGLPGSGKTTLGAALYYRLKEKQNNVVILDGDILKSFVCDATGYSKDDRLLRAEHYANICKILSDQGICVIICTIAMFDSVREWNRQNIEGYVEIFIDTSYDVVKSRCNNSFISDFYGKEFDENIELPKDPDYVVNNNSDGGISSFVEDILKIKPRSISDYDRDRKYWNNMYSGGTITESPSDFAVFTLNHISKYEGCNLLELGCGNGRDSLFFMRNGIRVTAIDASNAAIEALQEKTCGQDVVFVCDDFVKCKTLFQVKFDSVYSRFTLHSITEKQEDELLDNVKDALKPNGNLYIEARTIHDDLYGKGTKVSENAYEYNGHYRRFIDCEKFIEKMKSQGFTIKYFKEDRGFSKTSESDPVLMRIIASYDGNGHN